MIKESASFKNISKFLKQGGIGGLGAAAARAGVGKTALLVQMALSAISAEKKVLHISLKDPVNKVDIWYSQFVGLMTKDCDKPFIEDLTEKIGRLRLIMTFSPDNFSFEILEKRLLDLLGEKVFAPDVIIIDGMEFDENIADFLASVKDLSKQKNLSAWFTVHTHRHQEPDQDGIPVQFQGIADMFEVILKLEPDKDKIRVKTLKGQAEKIEDVFLDPATMMLTN